MPERTRYATFALAPPPGRSEDTEADTVTLECRRAYSPTVFRVEYRADWAGLPPNEVTIQPCGTVLPLTHVGTHGARYAAEVSLGHERGTLALTLLPTEA